MCALEVHCLTEDLICHELWAICDFKCNIRLTWACLVKPAAQTLTGGVLLSSLAASNPPPHHLCGGSGGLECLKCHISPLSSDLLFSQASMLLADPLLMQVDLMWHISSSITVGSWVRKAGTGGELVWERRGARAGLFLSRAAKIPPAPPPLDLFNIPHPWPEALDAPSAVMDLK